jgi:hypothetical protein
MNMTTSEADLFADMIDALSQRPEVDPTLSSAHGRWRWRH